VFIHETRKTCQSRKVARSPGRHHGCVNPHRAPHLIRANARGMMRKHGESRPIRGARAVRFSGKPKSASQWRGESPGGVT
jgi:hypothetical protein